MFLSRFSKLLQQRQHKGLTSYFNNYSTKSYKGRMTENKDDNKESKDSKVEKGDDDEKKPFAEKDEDKPEWYEAHKIAIENNQEFYTDPATGYAVMTEVSHLSRGYCCGNKCRHCPYNHENVGKKINLIRKDIKRVEKKDDKDDGNVENKNNE